MLLPASHRSNWEQHSTSIERRGPERSLRQYSRWGLGFRWRENRNAAEPVAILDIECELVRDSVHVHCCYQACIMDLNT